MKGLGCNAGFISWWHNKAPDDALILKILWEAGCVFYARTTQPQTLMHLETASNFYGTTTNPFNKDLTSGGSSGGEGALLGMRGSCLGMGTDIGGSVRSPAANCGIYSFRPTTKRVPYGGCFDSAEGQGMKAFNTHAIPKSNRYRRADIGHYWTHEYLTRRFKSFHEDCPRCSTLVLRAWTFTSALASRQSRMHLHHHQKTQGSRDVA